MPASTRIAAFFALSRFAQPATWHPVDYRDSETGPVIYDAPSEEVLDGLIESRAHSIRYRAEQFVGMQQGEKIEIAGVEFTVTRNPRAEAGTDGAVMIAELSRDEFEET